MMQLAQANWPILLASVLIGLLVAWLIFSSSRRTTVSRDADAPEDGSPARRNQALIDAPPVAAGAVGGAAVAAKGAAMTAGATEPTERVLPEIAEPEIAPAVPSEVPPVASPVAATTSPASGGDDLTRIKGVGPKLAAILAGHGITSFAQIAAWDDAEIDRIDAELGRFQGRIRRDDWCKQAGYLANGDTSGYESAFGKL